MSKVMCSDVSSQFVMCKRSIRRPPGKSFDNTYTIESMTLPASKMVLGVMSKSGIARIYSCLGYQHWMVQEIWNYYGRNIYQSAIYMLDLHATSQRSFRISWTGSTWSVGRTTHRSEPTWKFISNYQNVSCRRTNFKNRNSKRSY